MATLTPTLKDHGYKNWVKGGLALKFSREGIENFVETNIDKFHQNILASLPAGPFCYNCSIENIVQCKYNNNFCKFSKNNCTVHDPRDSNKKSRPCPNSVCNVIRDEILKKHRFHGPSWKNTDSSRWCREPWQLATCYMSAGYTTSTSAAQTDLPGILSVVINNKIFDTEVTDNLSNKNNLFCQARDVRKSILHKGDMTLSDAELAAYITTLNTMLSDVKCLARHPSSIQARTLLQQLLNGTINVTTRHEAEILAEALRSIEDKKIQAIAAVHIEKDDATVVINLEKDNALAAVNKVKDDARVVVTSEKDDALTAINKEKDDTRVVVNSQKDNALAAVNKEKDDVRVVVTSEKEIALTAINKKKDDASVVINSEKDNALAAVNNEKDDARVVVTSEKEIALTAINKEKDDANVVINSEKDNALAAINKEKDDARVIMNSDKDAGLEAVNKKRDNAKEEILSKGKEVITSLDNKEKLIIANLQNALLGAHITIKEKKGEALNFQRIYIDSYDKMKQDLKAELLSIYQDGEHLTAPLTPLDPSADTHVDKLYVPPDMKLEIGTAIETYNDIFEEGNKKIYVVGEAGTGKTSFCQKMVSTWCQVQTEHIEQLSDDQQAMENFDFLFYISLRDETTCSCVDEMIKHSLLPNKARLHEQLSKVLEEERCRVILDGLDEWTTEHKTTSSSHIDKGIPGRDSIRNCTELKAHNTFIWLYNKIYRGKIFLCIY